MWSRSAKKAYVAAATLALVACSEPVPTDPFDQAKAINESRHVAERFAEHPVVVDDTHGLQSLQHFFPSSETLVVSDMSLEAQLRAASIALAAHAPMLVYDPSRRQDIVQEIERLSAYTVLTVGDVSVAQTSGRVRVYRDPGGLDALGAMTSVRFIEQVVARPQDAASAVVMVDPQVPTWLRAAWADPEVLPNAEAKPFPILSRRDAQMAPTVVATQESSIAAIVNARSFGADVIMVNNPDPRASEETLFTMAGLAQLPLVALGSQFGTGDQLAAKIMQAEESYLASKGDNARPRN